METKQEPAISAENQWFGDMMILQMLADSEHVNDQEHEVLTRWMAAAAPVQQAPSEWLKEAGRLKDSALERQTEYALDPCTWRMDVAHAADAQLSAHLRQRPAEGDAQWFCELHPEHEMGHGGCDGVGIPQCAQVHVLANHNRLLRQEVRETAIYRDEVVAAIRRSFTPPDDKWVNRAMELVEEYAGAWSAHNSFRTSPELSDAARAALSAHLRQRPAMSSTPPDLLESHDAHSFWSAVDAATAGWAPDEDGAIASQGEPSPQEPTNAPDGVNTPDGGQG